METFQLMYDVPEALRETLRRTRMAARMKDIAQKLNVSISTVSYALNGGPRPVPEDVRLRICEVARELGYRPNRLARSLASRRTLTIGVLPVAITRGLALVPYFQACFNGIVDESESLGYDVLLYTHSLLTEPSRQADMLLDGRVDGLIFLAPVANSPLVREVVEEKLPFSIVFGDFGSSIPCFTADNSLGISLAVKHLVELGHMRIAHIHGNRELPDVAERLTAFHAATAECGLSIHPDWTQFGGLTTWGGYDCAMRVLAMADRPTAIVCANDENAVGVYRAARDLNIRIPEQLSVVGFDDSPAAQILIPQLTTVRQPMERMGAAAIAAVVNLIKGETACSEVFETELVIRQSTSRPMEILL